MGETRNTKKPRLTTETPPRPVDIDAIPEASQPTKATKVINKLVVVALIIVAITIGIFLKWSFQSQQVLDVKEQPFATRTIREHPTAGGVVFVKADYCKLQNIEGELRLSFVSDAREVFLPLTRERGLPGCHDNEITVLIPKEIPAGTYKIKFRVTYNINPLKNDVTQLLETKEVVIDPTQ